ncbi:MAG TPA: sodium:proton antiporter, partial [Blastocatellia bacterium]|nr:sodium:proton antiporter [Blastocatellia bacterium]
MEALELILCMLAVSAAFDLVARRLSIPLPSLLVLGGLVLAIIPGLPRAELPPDLVFLIFVPPLVYWAALTIPFQDFRDNIRAITLLGVGLVLATMAVIAVTAHALIPGLPWNSSFVLGAIISPPDVIAVTAVTRRLKIPQVISTILEGEGLVNDATAFVVYRMAVTAVVAGSFSLWQAGFKFIWTAALGVGIGLVAGWLIGKLRWLVGRAPLVENTISLLTPYAVFIPAERLGLSSVLAVATTGLYLSRQNPRITSAETRIQAHSMWEILNFLLEGLIFIMIGLELPRIGRAVGNYSLRSLTWYVLVLSAVLIVVRIAWMFPGAYLPRLIRRRLLQKRDQYPSWRGVLFAGWAGVRGADSLV